jgi:hypothetical protein
MTKTTKIILIAVPLLLIGGGIFALTKKKPAPTPPTPPNPTPPKKKAEIIIGNTTGGIDPFLEYPTGNYFFVKEGVSMWLSPSKWGSEKIKTYQAEDSVNGLQIGTFNGDNWVQVDDFDDIGWIMESDLFQVDDYGNRIEF